MTIISIQSAVAYGHVGNSAAVFPLQRLGFEVWAVDTVQFSNHPGHGRWRGKVMDPGHVREVVHGLEEVGALAACEAVLTGYLGDADSGEAALLAVEHARAAHPGALYLCDPVMGDDGPGLYVRPGIPEFLAARAVPAADIVTPNRFELAQLTGQAAGTVAEAAEAARALLARGPRLVVVTSLPTAGGIACLAVTKDGAWAVETPRLPITVNGAGDTLAALLLAHTLKGLAPADALSRAVSSLFAVLEATSGSELALIAAQDALVNPSRAFLAVPA